MAAPPASTPVTLSRTGFTVSSLGFGCMGITAFYGAPMEEEPAVELLKGVYALGYTHFDTAEVYRSGNPFDPATPETKYNEVAVGRFLQTLPRDSYTIATKFFPELHAGSCDLATVTAALDASLHRLGLSYVDLYYCHRMPETVEKLEEWMTSAKALVAAGKVRHVGLSEVGPDWLRKAYAVHPVACIQQEWSLLSRSLEGTLAPVCKELGVGIVAYSPLARNLLVNPPAAEYEDWRANQPRYKGENLERNRELFAKVSALAARTGRTPAQLSLAWLYHKARALGVAMVPIPGTTKLVNAADNAAAVAIELAEAEAAELEELGALVAGPRYDESYTGGFESQL